MAHGPRAAIVAPPGRCLISFDADGLHYREAGFLSQDPFIQESLEVYDAIHDPLWKPHVRNCAALFGISPAEAVELMNREAPQYTFAKNFIYMLLNGGDVPALANAAVSAGLDLVEKEVRKLLDSWLSRALLFDNWRKGNVREVQRTGMLVLPSGRRRRFYDMRWDNHTNLWMPSTDCRKEIYNFPLIGMEVDYMNPRFKAVWEWTNGSSNAQVIHLSHDGFMLEVVEDRVNALVELVLPICKEIFTYGGRKFTCPWDVKVGKVWSELKKWNGKGGFDGGTRANRVSWSSGGGRARRPENTSRSAD